MLEWPAAQVADLLGMTTTAVNSALRRARAALAAALPAEDELAEPAEAEARVLLDRFAAAIQDADARGLAELLREDVALEMPPLLTWFTGRQTVTRFFASRALDVPGRFRLVPVTANGQPGVAVYQRQHDGASCVLGDRARGHHDGDRADHYLPQPGPVRVVRPAAGIPCRRGRTGAGAGPGGPRGPAEQGPGTARIHCRYAVGGAEMARGDSPVSGWSISVGCQTSGAGIHRTRENRHVGT